MDASLMIQGGACNSFFHDFVVEILLWPRGGVLSAGRLRHAQATTGTSEDPCMAQLTLQGLSVVQESRYLSPHALSCPQEAAWPINMAVGAGLCTLSCIASHAATPALQHYQWWGSMLAIATGWLAIGRSPGSFLATTLPIGRQPSAQSRAGTSHRPEE